MKINFRAFHAAVPVMALLSAAVLAQAENSSLTFVPMVSCRAVDTRQSSGTFGGPDMMPGARDFAMQSSACSVPNTAVAYSLNVTAMPKDSLGFLTIYPTGQDRPNTSTLNAWDGGVVANSAIVAAGTGGSITVFASDETDLLLDINGYFIAAPMSQGSAGSQGAAGATGPAGSQGPAGATGPAGLQGSAGAPGTPGPIGPIGPVGARGLSGSAGAAGVAGAAGAAGPTVFTASIPTLTSTNASQYAGITGLNQTTSNNQATVTSITGLSCSSETLTVVRTGAGVTDQTRVYLYVNGAWDGAHDVACVNNGTTSCSFTNTAPLQSTDTVYYLTGFWGSPGTGGEYISMTCNQ